MALETKQIVISNLEIMDSKHKYKCITCNKKFHTPLTLLQHTHFIHNAQTTYSCGFCGKDHITTDELNTHIHRCDDYLKTQTSKKFTNVDTCPVNIDISKEHNKLHKNKQFICDACGRVFKQKGNMDKHRLCKHNIPLPSTRQTRHKLRLSVKSDRYTSYESDIKRCSRYAVRDNTTNKTLTDDDNNIIYLSRSVSKKYMDNCNILYGLLQVYTNYDESKKNIYDAIKKEWPTFKDAVLSIMKDRPNQHDMIISIVDYHIEI